MSEPNGDDAGPAPWWRIRGLADRARRASGTVSRRRPELLSAGAIELRQLVSRSREVVVFSAIVGGVTGLGVALFETVTADEMLDAIFRQADWIVVLAPLLGLTITAVIVRYLTYGTGVGTTDAYIQAIPEPDVPFDTRPAIGRILASIATLGFGGSLGFEGPSMYLGTSFGAWSADRLRRFAASIDRRTLVVAGAAAGVAAIFKAPATGAVFALEVPYQEDLVRKGVLPALVGAATGYVAFVSIKGTEPLVPVAGNPPIGLEQIGVAVLVGLLCGLGARVFAWVVRQAKHLSVKASPFLRVPVSGAVLAVLTVVSLAAFDHEPLSLGPGFRSIEWALDPSRSLWLIALLATIRVMATSATLTGGGVGGLFVPLVVQGALTGRLVSGMFATRYESLMVVVGIAAFLGAGYRVPLAAVMFVAEATGRPGFVVPGLLAAVAAQLVMGSQSVSAFQRGSREGHLEDRAELPIASVLSTDSATADPDSTVEEYFAEHVVLARRDASPVVRDGRYEGLVTLSDLLALDPETWSTTRLADVARRDVPTAAPDWTVGQAFDAMIRADLRHLPVVDSSGELRGVVTAQAILDLESLLDRLTPTDPRQET